jgi:acyl-CoA thioester hydrolase
LFKHTSYIRVRYAETDQMAYVYYGQYATYLEVARVEALRSLGIRYKDLETDGVMMPVLELRTKYIRPAKYDDLIRIELSIPILPQMRIKFNYDIYNEEDILLTVAETTLVFVDMKSGRPVLTPEHITEALRPHYPDELES